MEKLIIPVFAVFGFLGSLFFDSGEGSSAASANVTQTGRATLEGDS
jgi:hypothetical protein